MKKLDRKLLLARETLMPLQREALGTVVGGIDPQIVRDAEANSRPISGGRTSCMCPR